METKETGNRPKVTVVKEFSVDAEKVFDAWIDPEKIGRWMFGPNVRDEEIVKLETNPEKSGTFSFVVRRDGGDAARGLRIFNKVRVGAGPVRGLLAVEF